MKTLLAAIFMVIVPPLAAAQDYSAWQQRTTDLAGSVSGQFIERAGGLTFIPDPDNEQNSNLQPVSVANPKAVSSLATGTKLDVILQFDPQSQKVEVSNYKLSAESDNDVILGANNQTASPLDKYRAALDQLLQPGAMSADITESVNSPTLNAMTQFEREASRAYEEALVSGDTAKRTESIKQIAAMRRQAKAIFGPTIDNFDPWTYEKIHSRSRSVVAVADGILNAPICSGFLIAEDLVMTAGHCFKNGDIADIEIWFGFEEVEGGGAPRHQRHLATELVYPAQPDHDEFFDRAVRDSFEADFLDIAVLRFSLTDCAGGQDCVEISDGVQPVCLRTKRIHRNQPLYLIGYPKGKRAKVHDNARMYLPHSITRFILADIRKEIEVDFAALPEDDRIKLVDDLTSSYQSDGSRFRLIDLQFGGQPKFGLIADTFKGNSGSPVFFRSDHCVAGVLIGGAPDTGERLLPSWVNHESAVPMSAVLESIEEKPETALLLELLETDMN